MQKLTVVSLFAVLAALFSGTAAAQASSPLSALKEAIQAAVLKNPEVQARWHAFNEAKEEIGVARGGFFPKIDLSAGTGRIETEQKRIGIDGSYHGNESSITLRQMLFDGFATSREVKRLGKAKLVRYFELLNASEDVALEAARAYLDVIRYREQVKLAEDNYVQHYAAHEQLKRRAASGVGKQVDVDQAASRLALADVNVTTAYANLHDVTARYIRIVGINPPKEMGKPERVAQSFPKDENAALVIALQQNPALRASVENIEAAQYDLDVRRSAFWPRLDFVARRDHYSNYEDNGSRDESRVELRLNYNLFNGGSDAARDRQYRERKNLALDLREKACRDMRQTLAIAFNDTLRLSDQLSYLATQVELVARTRTAYRDQFNIGQRTLLDLLNTQNEYFDARRAEVNVDVDLSLAYLRSYAGMGRLLEVLDLKHVELEDAPEESDFAAVNLEQLCPSEAPANTRSREALLREAKEMSDKTGFIGTRSQPAAAASPKR
ncbi:MAG: TolC family outer membrane protein [Azoarcus sp.]|nr:TolC family outer membrane protein [Azoarcus sp.]